MTTLDTSKYGLPISGSYSIDMDLALLSTDFQSGWKRQRRTYLHNASQIQLTWRLPLNKAQEFIAWLQDQPDNLFFECLLLTGNDINDVCSLSLVEIRRTTNIITSRIPRTNLFTISFGVETKTQGEFELLSSNAENQSPANYPSNLPLPTSSGFSSVQGFRNITEYVLTYRMNTEMMTMWLAFAGYIGTAWFKHPMVSPNVPCGYEYLRYTSNIGQTLIEPNVWSVTITAETMPSSQAINLVIPAECPYDNQNVLYDDIDELYDCNGSGGGPIPPQGNFVMPTGTLVITDNEVGTQPLTGTTTLKLFRDGSVITEPPSVPVWLLWHTAPLTQPNPAVSFDQVVEISRDDGATWVNYTPLPGGLWLGLKNNDVWARFTYTSTYDVSRQLAFNMTFREDQLPTPSTHQATGAVEMNINLDVTNPIGPQEDVALFDGYMGAVPEGGTVDGVSAGLTFLSDGTVMGQSTNTVAGYWYFPVQINAGTGLWIKFTGNGNGDEKPYTASRISMAGPTYCYTYNAAIGGGSFASVTWNGTYTLWDAETGGNQIGNGSITLESEVSP